VPPEHRKAAYAVSRLGINLGMSVGPALGGFIAERSFRAIFWVDGATSLAAGLILVLVPLGVAVGRAARDAAALARAEAGEAPALAPSPAPSVLRDRRMLLFLAANVLVAAGFFQHIGAMPLYLVRNLGFTPKFYGILFTLNTVLIVLLEIRVNFGTAHWTHRRALLSGALLVGAGFGALAFARAPWAVAATVVVWTFGEMILLPGMSNFVADIAPEHRRGEYMGYYTMAWGIAFSFGPGLGTIVLDRFGPVACWLGTFVFCAAGGWIMSRLEGVHRP
jgi:predicted MFS family arabinose efflux permease